MNDCGLGLIIESRNAGHHNDLSGMRFVQFDDPQCVGRARPSLPAGDNNDEAARVHDVVV